LKILVALGVVVVTLLPAQQVSQLPVCMAFNDTPLVVPTSIYLCNTMASVAFVAPSSFTVTEIETYGTTAYLLCASVAATGSVQASGCVSTVTPQNTSVTKWWTIPVAPVAVAAGSTCTVSFWPATNPGAPTGGGMNPMYLYSNTL
jgi:hypothetical protein